MKPPLRFIPELCILEDRSMPGSLLPVSELDSFLPSRDVLIQSRLDSVSKLSILKDLNLDELFALRQFRKKTSVQAGGTENLDFMAYWRKSTNTNTVYNFSNTEEMSSSPLKIEALYNNPISSSLSVSDIVSSLGFADLDSVPANHNGVFDIEFTQHLRNLDGLLEHPVTLKKYYARRGPGYYAKSKKANLLLNNDFPFLDALGSTQPIMPKVRVPNYQGDPIRTKQTMEDFPGLSVGTTTVAGGQQVLQNPLYSEIDYTFDLRTAVNWVNSFWTDQVQFAAIIYPLGFMQWRIRHKLEEMTISVDAKSQIWNDYTKSNSHFYPYVDTLANAAFETKGPF
jgi:hypothetical protein